MNLPQPEWLLKSVISCIIFLFMNVCTVQAKTVNVLGYNYPTTSDSNSADEIFRQILESPFRIGDADNSGIAAQTRPFENKSARFLITVLLLYFFGGIRLIFSQQFASSINLMQNWQRLPKKLPENDSIATLSFYILYFITVGFVLFFYISPHWDILRAMPLAAGIGICIAVIVLLFLIRILIMFLFSWVFGYSNALREYIGNVLITYKLSAILLFPCALIILLARPEIADLFLQVSITLLLLALTIRYVRNAALVKKLLSMNFLHFFMYLCAFEMLPLWVIIKLIR